MVNEIPPCDSLSFKELPAMHLIPSGGNKGTGEATGKSREKHREMG